MVVSTAAVVVFALGCVFFTFVGVVGLLRLPDVYTRAHAVSKADTLGAGFALLAVAVSFGLDLTAVKALLLFVVVFVTNPTAVHALVRSAYSHDVEVFHREREEPQITREKDG